MLYDNDLVGQEIDRFRVLEHIGRGGMADVYLAQDTRLHRRVVLKLMLPDLAVNEELTARFQREAQTTAQLAHPNIVQIYTIGLTPDGRPYLGLQYMGGDSLGHFLQELAREEKWDLIPMPSLRIGIALNVTDNDTPGTAVQEVMKSTSKERNFTHPDTWGTLTLKE